MARIAVVDPHVLAGTAAERITALITESIAAQGRCFVSLTGGSTSRTTYEALADPAQPWRHRIDWSRVHLFWGDERHVPPDHPDSNFGMANQALLQHVPIPPAHVHRMRGELPDPFAAAAEYETQLPDVFDVMLLGLGEDCHIASIFPDSELLKGHQTSDAGTGVSPRVSAVSSPKGWRITLTPPVILASRAIVMIVSGAAKAAAVTAAIAGPLDVQRYPGQILREAGDRVDWILDSEAASGIR